MEKISIACILEAMDESGAGDRSTAVKLPEKVKGEDVKKSEIRVGNPCFFGFLCGSGLGKENNIDYSVIHEFIPAGRANHYMPSLKAGSIM
ncbi:hypothetical protein YC2023_087995 [Brassica napus]